MMMDDDARPAKPNPFQGPSDDELHRLSVDELGDRIDWLRSEIERTEAILAAKHGAMSDAESIFKK
jgi:uncharacterized small protein (DUF1192 family)